MLPTGKEDVINLNPLLTMAYGPLSFVKFVIFFPKLGINMYER